MTAAVDRAIFLTSHAADQLRRRDPVFWREHGQDGAVFEVYEAIRQGRFGKSRPRENAGLNGRKSVRSQKSGGTHRYAWSEDGRRCYALVGTSHEGVSKFYVKTVLVTS